MNNIIVILSIILGLILFGSLIISSLNKQLHINNKMVTSTQQIPFPHDKTESKYATLEGFEDLKISTPTSEETDRLLVKKNEVDYDKKIYDTSYLFQKQPSLVKTNNIISFWEPYLDSGIYSLGHAIGKDIESKPENHYTAISGEDMRSPIKYLLIYKHGRPYAQIKKDISAVDAVIKENEELYNKYKKMVDIYDSTDPRSDLGKVYSSANSAVNSFLTTNANYFNNNKAKYPNWEQYRGSYNRSRLDRVQLPPHITVSFTLPYYTGPPDPRDPKKRKTPVKETRNISGTFNDMSKIKFTTVDGVQAFETQDISAADLLENSMLDTIFVHAYRKNPKAREYWASLMNTYKATIDQNKPLLEKYQDELLGSVFSIWKPVPPKDYRALGYVVRPSHDQPLLDDIKCVPERCTKIARKWLPKDRVMVIENQGQRVSIYRNPFHMTFAAVNEKLENNRWVTEKGLELEDDSIYRIYPCLPKCEYVDNLIESDKCAKNLCANRKNTISKVPLISSQADAEEEKHMLNEIKEQEEYLDKLKSLVSELDKKQNNFNIVNTEHNRHKFGKHIKDQSILHKDTINRLLKTKDAVAININSPGGIDGLKKLLLNYIKHHAGVLEKNKKAQEVIESKPAKELGPQCTNWTDFKKNHYCKYSNPPCFGCINPT
jgi:hypothetical protein